MNRPIKTQSEYETALAAIEELMDINPEAGTPEADRLDLLALLVQDYESRLYPIESVDPIDAIHFRMEQLGLTQRDLIPYLGNRSKVSEVLSGKRSLTLAMIRSLNDGLGIPLKALLQERSSAEAEEADVVWERFPVREMVKRGWIEPPSARLGVEQALRRFFSPLGSPSAVVAMYRKSDHIRSARAMDELALTAWAARVVTRGITVSTPDYKVGVVNTELVRELLRLSRLENGPKEAADFLQRYGVALVIEPHLPRTHLDGAAIKGPEGKPIIGLTLRHDRIDYFWFCLVHELAHVALHLEGETTTFYDDLDADGREDIVEKEADEWAGEALIPLGVWQRSPASRLRSPEAAQDLADKLTIHPAIVAGRMRHEFNNYRLLNHLVGLGQVRRLFPEIDWGG